MTILTALKTLSDTPSTNDKLAFLIANKGNDVLKKVFWYAYNPKIKYFIKKRPKIQFWNTTYELMSAVRELHHVIADRVKTGNSAIEHFQFLLSNLSPDDQEVLYRIVERDLRCGVNAKLLNKAWGKDFIPEYPVLLCGKFNQKTETKIKYPAFFQLKMDSSRINAEFEYGRCISLTTRNGNVLDIKSFNPVTITSNEHCIIDGELMWKYPDGTIAERKISNGYVTKAVRGTITPEEEKGLYIVAWDYVKYSEFETGIGTVPYRERLDLLAGAISQSGEKIQLVETCIVNSKEEALKRYDEYIELGEEGGILKNFDMMWQNKRSNFALKLKAEDPADLLVVGFEYGKPGTQFQNVLGSLICETSCGKLRVNVGSGFKHNERNDPDSYLNKIIKVKYNALIDSVGSDIKSMFLPIYDGIRYDKDVANSLEELI